MPKRARAVSAASLELSKLSMEQGEQQRLAGADHVPAELSGQGLARLRSILLQQGIEQAQLRPTYLRQILIGLGLRYALIEEGYRIFCSPFFPHQTGAQLNYPPLDARALNIRASIKCGEGCGEMTDSPSGLGNDEGSAPENRRSLVSGSLAAHRQTGLPRGSRAPVQCCLMPSTRLSLVQLWLGSADRANPTSGKDTTA